MPFLYNYSCTLNLEIKSPSGVNIQSIKVFLTPIIYIVSGELGCAFI